MDTPISAVEFLLNITSECYQRSERMGHSGIRKATPQCWCCEIWIAVPVGVASFGKVHWHIKISRQLKGCLKKQLIRGAACLSVTSFKTWCRQGREIGTATDVAQKGNRVRSQKAWDRYCNWCCSKRESSAVAHQVEVTFLYVPSFCIPPHSE